MWDLPGPGLEPVSPALAGGFSTTAPLGQSLYFLLYHSISGKLTPVELGEGTCVPRHTEDLVTEPGPWAPSKVCPGAHGSHSLPCPGRWKADSLVCRDPRGVPLPSLSCLVPCPLPPDGPALQADLAPTLVPHPPASPRTSFFFFFF